MNNEKLEQLSDEASKLKQYKDSLAAIERKRKLEKRRANALILALTASPFMANALLEGSSEKLIKDRIELGGDKRLRPAHISEELKTKAELKRIRRAQRNIRTSG